MEINSKGSVASSEGEPKKVSLLGIGLQTKGFWVRTMLDSDPDTDPFLNNDFNFGSDYHPELVLLVSDPVRVSEPDSCRGSESSSKTNFNLSLSFLSFLKIRMSFNL